MKSYFVKISDASYSIATPDEKWLKHLFQNDGKLPICQKCRKVLLEDKCPDLFLDSFNGDRIPKGMTLFETSSVGIGIISKVFVDIYPKFKEFLYLSNVYYDFDKKEIEPNYFAYIGRETVFLNRVEGLPYLRPVYEENYHDFLKEPHCPSCGRAKQRPMEPKAKYNCLAYLPKREICTLDYSQRLLVTEEIAAEIKSLGIKKLNYTKIPYVNS